MPPSSAPAAQRTFACAGYGARQSICPARTRLKNRRIKFEAGLAPLECPRCSEDVRLCGIRSAAIDLPGANESEKPQDQIRGGPCPLERPRCSEDVPLCGIRSAAIDLPDAKASENRRIKFEAGLPPRAPPLLRRRSLARNTECGKRNARPGAIGSGAGTVCLIRRGTAAGTRVGCSSPPRTAKRRRRERVCPCRSR